MPSKSRQFGDIGEREAEVFLVKNGYRILDRNYRIKNIGEIDLVCQKGVRIFFFEVKTRDIRHEGNFPYWTAITPKKKRNLKKICNLFLAEKDYAADQEWQVDTIFVKVDFSSKSHSIEHLENILWERYY